MYPVREVKNKKIKHLDGLSPHWPKTPPSPPQMWTMFLFYSTPWPDLNSRITKSCGLNGGGGGGGAVQSTLVKKS